MSDSLITKKAIAASIKELLNKKSFDKITVADIVQNCGLNRQTFYYHFQDKFDLVNWIYYNEIILAVTQNKAYTDWSNIMLDALNIMRKEKNFYIDALNAEGQNKFQEYFFNMTKEIFLKIIDQIANEFNDNEKMGQKDRNFIAEFCSFGLVGIVIQWARGGMKETPQEIVGRLKHFVNDSNYMAAARYFRGKNEDNSAAGTPEKTE